MGSLTFSEMATIAVIVLIVFGPRRLPEIARRAGAITSRLRDSVRDLRDEFREEYAETVAPLEDVRSDLQAARDDVTEVAKAIGNDIERATGDDGTTMGASLDGQGGVATPEAMRERLRAARGEPGVPDARGPHTDDPVEEAPES